MKLTEGERLSGSHGSAVEVLSTLGPEDPPDWQATLGLWFLHCPGQSPAWDDYLLSVIHLRPIEGVRPAVLRLHGATHEVMLVALDPVPEPVPTDGSSWRMLQPINLEEQVVLHDDAQAKALLRDCARAVVHGLWWAEPPLSGQVEPWRTGLIKTAAHLRGEPHAP